MEAFNLRARPTGPGGAVMFSDDQAYLRVIQDFSKTRNLSRYNTSTKDFHAPST